MTVVDPPVAAVVRSAPKSELGESPVWHRANGVLVWVDITGRRVHLHDPATEASRSYDFATAVSAVAPRTRGYVLALGDGVAVVDALGDEPRYIARPFTDRRMRFNDAKCDSGGRLWVGLMSYDSRPGAGSLYRVDPDGAHEAIISQVTTSNGLDWNKADDEMYFVDSALQRVDVLDFDKVRGSVSNRRPLVNFSARDGVPDGLTVDSGDCIWVALWGGSQVRRYSAAGEHLDTVVVPTSQVSSCAFGDHARKTLYITTAAIGEAPLEAQQPLAGCLFRVETSIRGRAANVFGG